MENKNVNLKDVYKCKRCKKKVYVKYTTCPRCGYFEKIKEIYK